MSLIFGRQLQVCEFFLFLCRGWPHVVSMVDFIWFLESTGSSCFQDFPMAYFGNPRLSYFQKKGRDLSNLHFLCMPWYSAFICQDIQMIFQMLSSLFKNDSINSGVHSSLQLSKEASRIVKNLETGSTRNTHTKTTTFYLIRLIFFCWHHCELTVWKKNLKAFGAGRPDYIAGGNACEICIEWHWIVWASHLQQTSGGVGFFFPKDLF